MFSTIQYFKIYNSIISYIKINMVNYFFLDDH